MCYWKCIIKLNELSAYAAVAGSSHMSHSDSLQVFNATIYFLYRRMNNFFSNCQSYTSWNSWHLLGEIHLPKCHMSLCIFWSKFRRNMHKSSRLPYWSLAMTGCIFFCYVFFTRFEIFKYLLQFNKIYPAIKNLNIIHYWG